VFENTKMLKAVVPTLLTLIALGCSAGQSISAKDLASAAEGAPLETTLPAYNHNALHRVDFRVTGKSCAVCLHKIQERMKGLPGAVEAAVMLKKPYGAVVIYDSSKLNLKAILDIAVKGEPEVKIVDVKDESIKKLPVVLIPAYSQVPGEG
jgi:copper chaperone CopZ